MMRGARRASGGSRRLLESTLLIVGFCAVALLAYTSLSAPSSLLPAAGGGRRHVLPDVLGVEQGVCPSAREQTEFGGDVVKWGEQNMQPDAGACCASCHATAGCNTWVFCANTTCSGGSRRQGECWLKAAKSPAYPSVASSGATVGWTSGALFDAAEAKRAEEKASAEEAERDAVRFAPGNPTVYLDVSINDGPAERIEFVLFMNTSPRAAENFLGLCRGDRGNAPPGAEGAGRKRSFVGAQFYRILDQFIDQAGANTDSVFGGAFKDDPGGLELRHNRKGLLSMANSSYTIFGEITSGFDVAARINKLASPSGTPTGRAIIVGAGQLS